MPTMANAMMYAAQASRAPVSVPDQEVRFWTAVKTVMRPADRGPGGEVLEIGLP
jgi:hypothetical protein